MKGVCQFYVNTYNRRKYYIEPKTMKTRIKVKLPHREWKEGDNLTHWEERGDKECQNDSKRDYLLFSLVKKVHTTSSNAGSEIEIISPFSSMTAMSKMTLNTSGLVIIINLD